MSKDIKSRPGRPAEAAWPLKDWFPGAATGGEPPGRQRVRKGNISVNLALKFRMRS